MKKFLIGLAFLNLILLISFLLTKAVSEVAAFMIYMFILAIPLLFFGVYAHEKFGPKTGWAVWIGTFIGAPMVMTCISFYSSQIKTISDISVKEAPKYSDYQIFHFNDGEIATNIEGIYSYETTYKPCLKCATENVTVTYNVKPVIYKGWEETKLITMWAACPQSFKYTSAQCILENSFNKLSAINFNTNNDLQGEIKNLQRAIEDAETKYNIKTEPNAPIIYIEKNPELVVKINNLMIFIFIGITNFIYLMIFIFKKEKTVEK